MGALQGIPAWTVVEDVPPDGRPRPRRAAATAVTRSFIGPGGGRLELVPLTSGAWRLCDRSVPSDDAESVLAYLEQSRSGYDVVWLCGARAQTSFATVDEVLAVAGRLVAAARTRGPERPVRIPHHAPARG